MADDQEGGPLWRVFADEELIGEIANCGFWDMGWTFGDFHARGRFEQDYRVAFDEYIRRHDDPGARHRVLAKVRDSLHLVDPQGRRHSIFSLVVDGEHARFRLARHG